jgi:hypothetical protein
VGNKGKGGLRLDSWCRRICCTLWQLHKFVGVTVDVGSSSTAQYITGMVSVVTEWGHGVKYHQGKLEA